MAKMNNSTISIVLIAATWLIIIFMVSSLNGDATEILGENKTPHPINIEVESPEPSNSIVDNVEITGITPAPEVLEPTKVYEEVYSSVSIDLSNNDSVIIIDPGHGNPDPGACYNGVKESDINLEIGLKTAEYLENLGYKVALTRKDNNALSSNTNIDLNKRCQIANSTENGILFVSIHANANTTASIKGGEVYYYGTNSSYEFSSKEASKIIAEEMDKTGLYQSECKCIQKGFQVLKYTQIPAVLIEVGYISNKDEVEVLKNKQNQSKIAESIVDGIDKLIMSSIE